MADEKMKYFRLTDDIHFPNRWYLGDVKNVDNWTLVAGRLPPGAPSDLKVEVYRAGEKMDFTLTEAYGVPIVSARLQQVLGNLPGIRFLNAKIEGEYKKSSYFAMLIESTVNCVDESRSEFEKFTADDPVRPDKAGQYSAFYQLFLDKAKAIASGRPIFRLGRFEVAIIVNADVKRAIEEAGVSGAVMVEV